MVTNMRVVTAWTPTATANAIAMTSSGVASPPCSSGGSPLSMAMPTSHGPVSAARLSTTISEIVVTTARRYGRSRSPSSRLLRSRSSAASPALTSSAFSVATPRHEFTSAVTHFPPGLPRP